MQYWITAWEAMEYDPRMILLAWGQHPSARVAPGSPAVLTLTCSVEERLAYLAESMLYRVVTCLVWYTMYSIVFGVVGVANA